MRRNDDFLRHINKTADAIEVVRQETIAEQEKKDKKRDDLQERGTVASETQADFAKRSFPFIIYTAVIATVALLLTLLQFVLWVAGL